LFQNPIRKTSGGAAADGAAASVVGSSITVNNRDRPIDGMCSLDDRMPPRVEKR
jgi:hypothetical protein